ncbi:hypothetical protein F5Y15DRAFT_423235 [Xylariaceae sp. FL0016]|nr:hypothetical protein F5Y15DRAFT_423235 [Xylariaceae sp. FL0016]
MQQPDLAARLQALVEAAMQQPNQRQPNQQQQILANMQQPDLLAFQQPNQPQPDLAAHFQALFEAAMHEANQQQPDMAARVQALVEAAMQQPDQQQPNHQQPNQQQPIQQQPIQQQPNQAAVQQDFEGAMQFLARVAMQAPNLAAMQQQHRIDVPPLDLAARLQALVEAVMQPNVENQQQINREAMQMLAQTALQLLAQNAAQQPDAPPQPPLSPWAARFGVPQYGQHFTQYYGGIQSASTYSGTRGSGIAPEYPRLDPKYYDDEANVQEPLELDNNSWHRLFFSEEAQKSHFSGIRSWEAGPLNFKLTLPGDEHLMGCNTTRYNQKTLDEFEDVYSRRKIEVDESKWFKFWQKSNWLDMYAQPGIKGPDGHPSVINGRWTVDDDRIWKHLSVCIELADRVLKTLIEERHPWLETLFWGRVSLWSSWEGRHPQVPPDPQSFPGQRTRVLLSRAMQTELCEYSGKEYVGLSDLPTIDEFRQKLDLLVSPVCFTFSDIVPRADWNRIYGCTTYRDPRGPILLINVTPLRSLCSESTTIAERVMLYQNLTETVEYTPHSLYNSRLCLPQHRDPDVMEGSGHFQIYMEPHLDFDSECEVGWSFERFIFGGTGQQGPKDRGSEPCMPITLAKYTKQGLLHVPTAWAWKMQSRIFWDSQPPEGTKRSDFFKIPTCYPVPSFPNEYGSPSRKGDLSILDRTTHEEYNDTRDALGFQRVVFEQMRPGYLNKRALWETTPWCNVTGILQILRFKEAISKKRDGILRIEDEYECDQASRIIKPDQEHDIVNWPVLADGRPHLWVYSAIRESIYE